MLQIYSVGSNILLQIQSFWFLLQKRRAGRDVRYSWQTRRVSLMSSGNLQTRSACQLRDEGERESGRVGGRKRGFVNSHRDESEKSRRSLYWGIPLQGKIVTLRLCWILTEVEKRQRGWEEELTTKCLPSQGTNPVNRIPLKPWRHPSFYSIPFLVFLEVVKLCRNLEENVRVPSILRGGLKGAVWW